MDRQLIEKLVDEKIRQHEIRIGIISGIIGAFIIGGTLYFVYHLYSLIQL